MPEVLGIRHTVTIHLDLIIAKGAASNEASDAKLQQRLVRYNDQFMISSALFRASDIHVHRDQQG